MQYIYDVPFRVLKYGLCERIIIVRSVNNLKITRKLSLTPVRSTERLTRIIEQHVNCNIKINSVESGGVVVNHY